MYTLLAKSIYMELIPSRGGREIHERLWIGVATHINIYILYKERRLAASI